MWRSMYLDTIVSQGIVRINNERLSGILLKVSGTDAKSIDGDVELIEYGFGTIAKLKFKDLVKLTNILFGDAVVDDPTEMAVFLPVVLDAAGYRSPFNGELRITFPAGYTITVSAVEGIRPSIGVAIDAFTVHVGVGRVKIESGVTGKAVQMLVLDGDFTEASLRTAHGDIVAEGNKVSLRGINAIFFTPETPVSGATLIAIGNRRDDVYLDLISAAEQDFKFIVVSALPDKIPPVPSLREARTVTK